MQRRKYHISVVEREVLEGLLEVPETKGTCLVLARTVRNVNMNDNKGGKFKDIMRLMLKSVPWAQTKYKYESMKMKTSLTWMYSLHDPGEGRRAIQYFDVKGEDVDKESSRMQDELRERVEERLQKQKNNYRVLTTLLLHFQINI